MEEVPNSAPDISTSTGTGGKRKETAAYPPPPQMDNDLDDPAIKYTSMGMLQTHHRRDELYHFES
jgi:hypothetical protein